MDSSDSMANPGYASVSPSLSPPINELATPRDLMLPP